MKTKFAVELISMYDALRELTKAKAALFVAQEALMAGRVGGIARELEMEIERYEITERRATIHQDLKQV